VPGVVSPLSLCPVSPSLFPEKMNLSRKQGVKPTGHEGSQMHSRQTDLTVFARDYPEARLVLEVKSALSSPPQDDLAVKQVVRSM
jgi:hypothetical protein